MGRPIEPQSSHFTELGSHLLNSGHPAAALESFACACELARATHGPAYPRALQNYGVALRLCHRLAESLGALNEAAELAAGDLRLHGRILRDRAMTQLALHATEEAFRDLLSSLALLISAEDEIEYYCSLGFLGRYYLLMNNRREAKRLLGRAHAFLQDHPPYELNNLIWCLKAMHLPGRLLHFRHALTLARDASHRGRVIEIWTLLIGGIPLHRLAMWAKGHIER